MYDVIIIGGGPAGLTAATYTRRAGLSVLVLEASVCGGQIVNSNSVENFPGVREIAGWQLASNLQEQAVSLGAEIKIAGVTGIELNGSIKIVKTVKADFEAKAVIIANGANPRKLDCPGAEEHYSRGVSSCATCDGAFFRGRKTAVVGGGNTAFEDALYLSAICEKVYLINRRTEYRAEKHLVETAKSRENIELLAPYIPVEVLGDESGKATGIVIENTDTHERLTLDTPGIFAAIGMIPDNAKFANVADLDSYGYFLSGEDCRTKTEGIYVAGDTRAKSLRQLITAASDGAAAATAAASYAGTWRE